MNRAPLKLPRLYPILDPALFAASPDPNAELLRFAEELLAAGARILQYRDKHSSSRRMLALAGELRRVNRGRATLIMNDRADLALAAGVDGVHLGQDDLSPAAARDILGAGKWIGFSTHDLDQLRQAAAGPADYLAFGPIFATASKQNPDPVVGLDVLRQARALTSKPLVAIGGISLENCRSVIDAGADSVAVLSALHPTPAKTVGEFLRVLGYKS